MSAALFRATNFESFRDGHQDFGENVEPCRAGALSLPAALR